MLAFALLLPLNCQVREMRLRSLMHLALGLLQPSRNAKMSTRLDFSNFPSRCLSSCQECDWSVKFRNINFVRNLNRSPNISVAVLTYSVLLVVRGFGELRDMA